MRTPIAVAAVALAFPTLASAHVTIQPRESKPGIEQRYTVRVPTEGQVATTSVELQIPDSVTVVDVPAPEGTSPSPQPASGEGTKIEAWLREYDAAFNAKDLDKLASFYHPDVTVYEGGGINSGWVDYRDRHLGPELKAFQDLQFSHANVTVHLLGDGRGAYAIASYTLKARMGERAIDSGGLATYVLLKAADGSWKIRHSHTSSRPRRTGA